MPTFRTIDDPDFSVLDGGEGSRLSTGTGIGGATTGGTLVTSPTPSTTTSSPSTSPSTTTAPTGSLTTTPTTTSTPSVPSTPTAPSAPSATTSTLSSSSGIGGAADWGAYLTNNPDVAQAWATVSHSQFPTPESYAQWHYQHYGQTEGRTLPTLGSPAPAPTPTPAPGGTLPGTTPTPTPTPTTPAPKSPGTVDDSGMGNPSYYQPPSYTPQDESVVDAVNRVTSSGSPLMTRAAGIGAAIANARGLQNSSLAAQSAQKAALDAAVPIASQEAQQAHQTNLQQLSGQQQFGLQQLQNENQSNIAQLQSNTSKTIATQQLAGASQSAFAQSLLAASQSYDANVSAIMANPDLKADARQAALNAAAAQRNSDYTMIQRVYGVSLSGSPSGSGSGGSSAGGGGLTWSGTGAIGGGGGIRNLD